MEVELGNFKVTLERAVEDTTLELDEKIKEGHDVLGGKDSLKDVLKHRNDPTVTYTPKDSVQGSNRVVYYKLEEEPTFKQKRRVEEIFGAEYVMFMEGDAELPPSLAVTF